MASNDLNIAEIKEKFSNNYGKKLISHLLVMAYGRKLYYIPGLISLIGLLFFTKMNKNKFHIKKYSYLILNLPKDEKDTSPFFSSYWIEKQIEKKKQIVLTLDNNEIINQKKFDLIKYEAGKLKYTQDTSTVLRIKFTNEVSYGTIVRLIDLCYSDEHKRFVLLKNSFVIFGEFPLPERHESYRPNPLFSDVVYFHPESPKKTLIEKLSILIRPFSIFQILNLFYDGSL